jgi:hypothetical protein
MNQESQARCGFRLRMTGGLVAVFALAACATTPPAPTASLEAAQRAISAAEKVDAGRYAPVELSEARAKLVSADAAVAERRMIAGDRLAEESRTEGELASARTAAVKAKAVNDEMRHSTGTLIEEMQRGSGDKL